MDELFDVYVLNRVIEESPPPPSWFLDRFFPSVQTGDGNTDAIIFDVDKSKPRLTPLVSPLLPGKPVPDDGYETNMLKPAYAKDLRRFDPSAPLRRRPGERIGGAMDPMARRKALIAKHSSDQLDALTRREVYMAVEALRTGKLVLQGEQYPTTIVDFKRDASLTVALAGGARWGEVGVSPSDDLELWANRVVDLGGGSINDVIMDPKAWGLIKKEQKFLDLLDNRRATNSTIEAGIMVPNLDSYRYVGNNGDLNFWVYNGRQVDDTGAIIPVLPDYSVMMVDSTRMEGTRAYGHIHDEEANYASVRYFQKSWLEKNPAIRWLLLQSAPLVFPYRPNATFYAKVR